jgi:DNA modification methylase/ParB-like chromosome segregation protein Spo0J
MNPQTISWVAPTTLQANPFAASLYSIPENYENIKENISQMGILTPLHVCENQVISGNLRLKIALELKMDLIPVLYVNPKKDTSGKLLAVSYGQQRVKKNSELLIEYEILEAAFPVGKGSRTDLNPELKKNMEKRKDLKLSKSKLISLKTIKKLVNELYEEDCEGKKRIWDVIDSEKSSLNRILKGLKREKELRENKRILPEHFELNSDLAKIFNKSCSDMMELEDKSIACIITSPPYFQMRDYGTGKNQRGLEDDIDTYIDGLIKDFKDCQRVLKDDGSLWVNLGEGVFDGQYNAIPHRFATAMMKQGWVFNDEWIWVKNNPVFNQAKRAIRSHEYIFHFVKSKDYYYDTTWLTDLTDPIDLISYGTSKKVSNLISALDFRGNIIRNNSNNMEYLRKECRESGFHLTHNAAFPITIPLITILTSSRVGDTILDIYSGTGTSGEAALATKRKYFGYEIKSEFVMASKVRLETYIQEELFEAA